MDRKTVIVNFSEKIIALDFEFADENKPPYMAGVFSPEPENKQNWRIDTKNVKDVLSQIERICASKELVVGHNLIDHDFKHLKRFYPNLKFLKKPIIDTLELSPLAFPKWPYHKLVKDYKLVSFSKNQPDEDAKISWILLKDEITSLTNRSQVPDSIFNAYANWFMEDDISGGYRVFFNHLAKMRGSSQGLSAISLDRLREELNGRACSSRFISVFNNKSIQSKAKSLALSWLFGADEFSVLSRWVRLRFSQIPDILEQLRNVDCGKADCAYCRSHFDLNATLEKYFGFSSLRQEQAEIVDRMVQRDPLLAILPTGGGKSLCYQLPALINADRRKTLTIVISPLQALMKDQLDNLRSKGILNAGAIYSGITPQERKEILEGIESGKIDIVYVAPEQLRNSTFISKIVQREIATWIIDEAHCVSKWGHDFRPDYLYIPRMIEKLSKGNNSTLPQIACFTATAKKDVILEIQEIFKHRLGIDLKVVNKGHERKELQYSTEAVDENVKMEKLIHLLSDEPGDAIVYVATKKNAKEVAESLNKAPELKETGKEAAYFHSAVDPREKKSIQDRFVKQDGDLNIIVATNAFGMGVDKSNVRLVVHYDIPGSLENYLQEAGRAGRDKTSSRCVLLYSPGDIEKQFQMKTMNRITKKDASEILRGLGRINKKTGFSGDVTVTAGEILLEEGVETDFEIGDHSTETKVKTALSILEESGILTREENRYNVFQVSEVIPSLTEFRRKLDSWNLSQEIKEQYESIYLHLLNSESESLVNVDKIAHLTGTPIKSIPKILRDLDEKGIIQLSTNLVVYINKSVRGDAKTKLTKLLERQEKLFELMKETAESWDSDISYIFDVRIATTKQIWPDISPDQVRELLRNFQRLNILEMQKRGRDTFTVKVKKNNEESKSILSDSRKTSTLLLNYIYQVADSPPENNPDSSTVSGFLMQTPRTPLSGADIRVEFTFEKLDNYIKSFFSDKSREERTEFINQTLLFMNDNEILRLGRGLAVLKSAMRILLSKDKKKKTIQFDKLLEYYKEQIFQVHVIEEYAEISVKAIVSALDFVADYFKLNRLEFRKKYFPDKSDEELERPASQADYHSIVQELNNKVQQDIIQTKDKSILVIAGPGSGKTRIIVHRAAYLLKIERVKPERILIVAFNREAVNEIKVRLRKLVKSRAASFVDIYTYHGIAMRLTGKAYSPETGISKSDDYFDKILKESVKILEKADDEDHEDWEERRQKLLRGYSHILVDEYQDIDEDCYRLISAIAGRTSDEESKLNIIAVGDDDQNIYSWKGSNVEYIKKFESDYNAQRCFLVENYRSTEAIIGASNQLISKNGKTRIKSAGNNEVRINEVRKNDPIGGRWATIDPMVDRGLVAILNVDNHKAQGGVIAHEIKRRMALESLRFSDIAILTRSNDDADFITEAFKRLNPSIPTRSPSPSSIPFPMYREVAKVLNKLESHKNEINLAQDIHKLIGGDLSIGIEKIWQYRVLLSLLRDFVGFNGRATISYEDWVQYLWDYAATQKGQIPDIDAVLVTTIHQAKGKEFNHVFLLDPGNCASSNKIGQTIEDERRLYYVGLTRAKEYASVLKVKGSKSSFADEILEAKSFINNRKGQLIETWNQTIQSVPENLRVTQMGLSNIWASSFARVPSEWFQRDKVQKLLENIPIGAELEFRLSGFKPKNHEIYIVEICHNQQCLGTLSQATAAKYQDSDGIKAEVGAIIQCQKGEDDKHATLDRYYAVLPRVIKSK